MSDEARGSVGNLVGMSVWGIRDLRHRHEAHLPLWRFAMSDEARRLLERLRTPGASTADKMQVYKDVDAFLAQPTAAREAVYVAALLAQGERLTEALVRTGKWSQLASGEMMCTACCTGMRCECLPGEHISREGCSNCLGKSGAALAPGEEKE